MDDQAQLLRIIDLLYGSILDEQDLPKALQALAEAANAKGIYCLTADPGTGAILRHESVGLDPAVEGEYREYFGARDIRIPPAVDVPVGKCITEHSVLDESTFRSSEIFGDFLQRHDIPHIMAMWTAKTPEAISALSLQRSGTQGPFVKEDEQRLAPLIPHLLRALRIRDLLHDARLKQHAYMDVVHRMPFGLVLLDSTLRTMEISNPAQQLIRNKHGLSCKNGRIHAIHADDDRRLQRAIFSTATALRSQTAPGDTVSVRRSNGNALLRITVVPVRSPHLFMSAVPSCMLVIFDPESSPKPAVAIVKKALQLTEAEALLSCVLFTGVSLREAAERLNLSVNTCKTQLKSIYAKTGCRSHVDLAKTLFMMGMADDLLNPVRTC